MVTNDQSSSPHDRARNIVFLGETGVGKSSTINLIAGSGAVATSCDAQAHTRVGTCYETTIGNEAYNLWDTRGLRSNFEVDPRGFFRSLFRISYEEDEREMRKFLQERYQKREIDLLVYCVRWSTRIPAAVRNYNTFCLPTRRSVAPVVLVVTESEGAQTMETWWKINQDYLRSHKMEFDGHACITALSYHPLTNVSKMTLHDLITRNYPWQAECDGSYFGARVLRRERAPVVVIGSTRRAHTYPRSAAARPRMESTRSEVQSSVGTWTYGKSKFAEFWKKATQNWGTRQSPAGVRSCFSSPHTAYDRTAQDSHPTTPVAGLASRTRIARATLPNASGTVQSQRGESDSTTSHLHSMFHASSVTGCSSCSELHPQPLMEDLGRYEDLTTLVKRKEQYASRSGGFGDIWECDLMTGGTQRKVAVKAVRAQRTDIQNLAAQEKKLRRVLNVWTTLQHENVVELLGVVSGFGLLPSMVSLWFNNGSLSSYLSNHEAMDLSGRQGLLFDIASGLRYLHSRGVVHGDLHGGNVLVDEKGRACLTDFGLSEIIQDFPGTSYLKSGACTALRYADPELVRQVHADARVVYSTKPSDVYSFGGLTLYVLSGKQPYEGIREFVLCTIILSGDRPLLPVDDGGISPQHESLIQRCWSPKETTRPSAEAIVTSLQEMSV